LVIPCPGKSYLFSGSNAEMAMNWREELLDQLAACIPCGYQRNGLPATEPTCLASIALAQSGYAQPALQALQWLGSIQSDDGSLGPALGVQSPGWATALAILARSHVERSGSNDALGLIGCANLPGDNRPTAAGQFRLEGAVQWLLAAKGTTIPRSKEMAHNSMLVGWPWVIGTHSWVEPTALAVLALKSMGEERHSRTREAVSLLYDRLLPEGGCNYGNTTVLGQTLRPHVQPTGLTLLALHGEKDHDGRIARSLEYLRRELGAASSAASMAYGVWALARYAAAPGEAAEWLAAAAGRRMTRESPLRMALLLLADGALECAGSTSLSFSMRTPIATTAHI
jgi:hypothetical protein